MTKEIGLLDAEGNPCPQIGTVEFTGTLLEFIKFERKGLLAKKVSLNLIGIQNTKVHIKRLEEEKKPHLKPLQDLVDNRKIIRGMYKDTKYGSPTFLAIFSILFYAFTNSEIAGWIGFVFIAGATIFLAVNFGYKRKELIRLEIEVEEIEKILRTIDQNILELESKNKKLTHENSLVVVY